ncbi:MAG: MFS transporter [Candidatus Thorarchaeota archaeon]
MPKILSKRTKILYGIGGLGIALVSETLAHWLAILYNEGQVFAANQEVDLVFLTLSLGVFTTAIALFAGRIVDAFTNPLVGHASDRTQSRWGRRRPYILFGTIPLFFAFFLIWIPPLDAPEWQIFLWAVILVCLIDALWTIVVTPYLGLLPELTPDREERTELSGLVNGFSLLGVAVALGAGSVAAILVGETSEYPPATSLTWPIMGLLVGLLIVIMFYIPFFAVREPAVEKALPKDFNLKKAFVASITNPGFRPFIISQFVFQWALRIISGSFLVYLWVGLLGHETASQIIIGALFIISITVGIPLWAYYSNHRTPLSGVVSSTLVIVVALPFVIVLPFLPEGLIRTGMACLIIIVGGIGVAGMLVLPYVVLAEIVDLDEQITGQRREAMYFGMNGFITKFGVAGGLTTFLILIDVFGRTTDNPWGIVGAALLSAFLMLISAFLFLRVPVGRTKKPMAADTIA